MDHLNFDDTESAAAGIRRLGALQPARDLIVPVGPIGVDVRAGALGPQAADAAVVQLRRQRAG